MDLSEYFRLKQAYETRLAQKKKGIRNDKNIGEKERRQKFEMFKRECINCKKEGGTTFRVDKTHYYAKCGASPPCSLDVKIEHKPVSSVRQQERAIEEKVNRIKNELIETTLDHLYKFADEESTLKRGNALRKDLQVSVDELVALRKGLERNLPQIAKLEALLHAEIAALRENEGSVTSIRQLADQLREAKYKHVAVEQTEEGKHALVQRTHTMDDYYR